VAESTNSRPTFIFARFSPFTPSSLGQSQGVRGTQLSIFKCVPGPRNLWSIARTSALFTPTWCLDYSNTRVSKL
jgi:hypothetical protein